MSHTDYAGLTISEFLQRHPLDELFDNYVEASEGSEIEGGADKVVIDKGQRGRVDIGHPGISNCKFGIRFDGNEADIVPITMDDELLKRFTLTGEVYRPR